MLEFRRILMRTSRRSFSKLCGSAAASSLAAPALAPLVAAFPLSMQGSSAFPYGTHVYREPPLPLEQLRSDFPLLKRLGWNMVKIQESWSADERKEGEIDLARVAHVVSDARQNGLLVYFGITMEQAPAWLWRKYPDARMQWENGEPLTDPTQYLLPNDGKPGPCWNHEGARTAAARFIEATARQIGKYDNILVWNVWQEVALDSGVNHLGLCYCPNTLAAFRAWLRGKYKDLEVLNRFWRTSYAEWDEVDPPRRFTKVPSMVDWRYFMENVYLAEALRFKAASFRRADPGHRRILAHTGSPRIGGSADWRLARQLDIYGGSNYPGWGEFQDPSVSDEMRLKASPAPFSQMLDNALRWDYLRSASVAGEFWTAELQGGRAGGGINPGRVPDPDDIRRWVLGAVAGGARGICFWNHRSEPFWDEAYGFGLLELKGGETARALEAGRIGKALNGPAADLFSQGSCLRAPVGILIDEDLYNFVNASGDAVKNAFGANLRGLHGGLFQEGVPVDFLDIGDLVSTGASYKALIHPFPLAMSEQQIEPLRAYVRSGGVLISGPCPGRFDRYGFGVPGEMPAGLTELFGAEHRQVVSLGGRTPHPTQSSFVTQEAASVMLQGEGEYAGLRLAPDFYVQYLTITTGRAVLRAGAECAGCANRFGSGTAYLIGTLPGPAILESKSGENQAFVGAVLRKHGVLPDRAGRLIRRRRDWRDRTAWFLFNTGREVVEETVVINPFRKAAGLLAGSLPVRDGAVTIRVAPLDIACVILEA